MASEPNATAYRTVPCQVNCLLAPSDYVSRRVGIYSDGSGHDSRQPAVHGLESHVTLCWLCFYQLWHFAYGTSFTDDRCSTIPHSGLHLLPSGLLQRSSHWDSQGPDEATTGCSECRTSSGFWGLSPWPCHATTAHPSLVANGTVSFLLNHCPHLEVYPQHCSSLPARAMHSSGQHLWSSQTTVCISWLHAATKSANIYCTAELHLQWAGSVEQSTSNTARQ